MADTRLGVSEREREDRVRTLPCPICGRPVGKTCRYPADWRMSTSISHTGRYDVAVSKGLVPAIRRPAWMS